MFNTKYSQCCSVRKVECVDIIIIFIVIPIVEENTYTSQELAQAIQMGDFVGSSVFPAQWTTFCPSIFTTK